MSLTDMQNKVEQKLDALSISLGTLKDQQKKLIENADKLKNCINVATETQVTSVKGRERQLIRQVDVVTAHQKSLIDAQIAKIMHVKGSLAATQEILQHCKLEDVDVLSKIIEGNLSSVRPVSPLKLISVQLDANPLNQAINSFGNVHLPDTIAHHPSAIIPAKIEDYGDSEHDVLHKSIGTASPNTTVKIQFPKIPQSAWLASSPQKLSPSLPPIEERKLSKDVSSWLANLRVSQNLEENKLKSFDFEEDHYLLDTPTKTSIKDNRSRCSSLSFEVVNCDENEKESCCMEENCEDKGRLLDVESIIPDKSSFELVPLVADEEFACQANEPCRSYDDCLCDGYCESLAKERALQNSRWLLKNRNCDKEKQGGDAQVMTTTCLPLLRVSSPPSTGIKRKLSIMEGCDEVLNHMSNIMKSSPDNWLSPESKRKSLKGLPESSYIVYKSPSKPWLLKSSMTATSVCPSQDNPSSIHFSPHSNIWLLKTYKEELKKRQESKSEISEQKRDESDFSVNDLKGALAELTAYMPRISPIVSSDVRAREDHTSHSSSKTNSQTTQTLFHTLPHHQDPTGRDFQRKLKWLSSTQRQNPVPGHVDIILRSPSFLPQSLVQFAENNLDKWLINRL